MDLKSKNDKQNQCEQRGVEWSKAISRDEKLCWESVFFLCFVLLIHLTLIAGTLGPPQFVHLFINLSIPTSPILCLYA